MAVTATVTPGKVFGDSDVITKETLNQLGQPTVSVDGSVGSLALSDGSVTNAKVAGDAAINLTKLEGISRGSVIIGNSSGKGAVVDANDNGKILVGDGTDLNSVAVSGDISLASTGVVTIASGAVEAGMLNTNAAATNGGLEVSSGMKIKDDGIDPLTKLAGHADREGQLISYDGSGDPAYVTKGSQGHVLKAGASGAPSFSALMTEVGTNSDHVGTDQTFNATHSLGGTPSLVRGVLVCTGTDGNYASGDEIDFTTVLKQYSGGFGVCLGANATHCFAVVRPGGDDNDLWALDKDGTAFVKLDKTLWKIKVYAAR
jgi:phage gpG-like protein